MGRENRYDRSDGVGSALGSDLPSRAEGLKNMLSLWLGLGRFIQRLWEERSMPTQPSLGRRMILGGILLHLSLQNIYDLSSLETGGKKLFHIWPDKCTIAM